MRSFLTPERPLRHSPSRWGSETRGGDMGHVRTSIVGKVERLRKRKGVDINLAIAEAVANALDAIEEPADERKGKIAIELEYGPADQGTLNFTSDEEPSRVLKKVSISDNGVGFGKPQIEAFQTAATTHKIDRGGLGAGRFTWLAFFRDVRCFSKPTNGGAVEIGLRLSDEDPITIKSVAEGPREFTTRVELAEPIDDATSEDISAESLCLYLVKTFFERLLPLGDAVAVEITSSELPSEQKHVSVTDSLTSAIIENNPTVVKATCSGKPITVRVVKRRLDGRGKPPAHAIHLCAHGRSVSSEPIRGGGGTDRLPSSFGDEVGERYTYQVYVESEILDDLVSESRTSFETQSFLDFDGDEGESGRVEDDHVSVRNQARDVAWQQLSVDLADWRKERREKLGELAVENEFIATRRIQVESDPSLLDRVDLSSPKKATTSIGLVVGERRAQSHLEHEEKYQKIFSGKIVDDEELNAFVSEMTDSAKNDLASFVVRRRMMLGVLKELLKLDEESRKMPLEERLHELVFPMRATSDGFGSDQHNLWMVDEQLERLRVVSDKRLDSDAHHIESESSSRPDVACYFPTGDEYEPATLAALIEFKRPGKLNSQSLSDQVVQYIREIRDGGRRWAEGRRIPIGEDCPVTVYVVGDIDTLPFKNFIAASGLYQVLRRERYVGYLNGMNAFVTLMSYEEMHRAAKERHDALFLALSTGRR